MKILANPIEMVSWTTEDGEIYPVRFRIKKEDGSHLVIIISNVCSIDKEKIAGNEMLLYKCQSVINNLQKIYEIKYELKTCKWILWKM